VPLLLSFGFYLSRLKCIAIIFSVIIFSYFCSCISGVTFGYMHTASFGIRASRLRFGKQSSEDADQY
jgi:hypothetical protein